MSVHRRHVGRLLFVLLWMLPGAVAAEALGYPILFVQEPVGTAEKRPFPGAALEGSRIVVLAPDGTLSVVTEGFAAAAEPCVSFDGRRVLFAGKQSEADPWDIWEMDADGSRQVRVTQGLGDCREPVYLPRAAVDSPNFRDRVRWVAFTRTASGVVNDLGDGVLTSLYAMNLEPVPGRGTVLWRTTYNLGGDVSPSLLSDGRVLFSARQRGAFALMAISWSGENLNPLYGSHDGAVSQIAACELRDRTVVFIEADGGAQDGGGRLACVSLRRPLHSHRVLDGGAGRYRTPHPLPDGRMLVSYAAGEGTYGVYVFDPQNGRQDRVYGDRAWNAIDAQPLAPRPVPPGRIPTVAFASVLDVGELKTVGQLQCLNVYDSDRPGVREIQEGEVRRVRLVEGTPMRAPAESINSAAPDSTWPPPGVAVRVLGEAPVEADGSFYVNVAGDIPFYIQTLDAQGRALYTMRAWMWVRAGDQRGCIGCHEDRELAPENRATQALVRARPALLAPPPAERRSVTFKGDVMPVLERVCARCHAGMAPTPPELSAEPDGAFNRAYTSLLRGAYVRAGEARSSGLVNLLNGAVEGVGATVGEHRALTEEEVRTIVTWIDLGARWDGGGGRKDGGADGTEE